ncbi:MAG: adenylate/guanylate cyclase domain-containing protein [Leptonema sp. (in: Bacteria)]|nr:adenylate/guanylate cyclase domain-containing protein [Leptonema sp. (in: bacteria)]
MLQLFWNWLAYLGVSTARNTAEHKHIILVNGLCIVLLFYLLVSIPLLLLVDPLPFWFQIPSFLFWNSLLLVLALNNRGKTRAARITLIVASLLLMICNSILTRGEANFHFFLLTEMLAVFFIFPSDEGRFMYPAAALALFTFLVFHFTPAPLLIPNWLPKTDIDFSEFQKTTTFGTATLIFAFSFYIQRTFRVADRILAAEKDKSERLLLNILPSPIVKQLKERPNTIAERFDECTVLFSDIVGFTSLTRSMPAVDVVSHLNTIFSAFDDLADSYGLEKIKTIGDAYMVVGGLPEPDPEHAEKIAHFALDILDIVQDYRKRTQLPLELRIGINSGDAVAGVIGKRKFIYDLWGDSVNTASRMESHGVPGKIQVTESTYQLIQSKFEFKNRGTIEVKGLGPIQSYILISKSSI